MSEYIHDLAMLKLQTLSVKELTNEQLCYEYRNIVSELLAADKKYNEEHKIRSGTTIGW